MAFQKFSNMEQSLFTRFVRLGVPYVELDAQGRARPRLVSFHTCFKIDFGSSVGKRSLIINVSMIVTTSNIPERIANFVSIFNRHIH